MAAAALTDTTGIVALAAAGAALAALAWCAVLTRSLRALRRNQRMVLGEGSERDVIAHGTALQEAFEALQEYVGDVAERLDGRLAGAEETLAGTVKHRALVRYDAYNELSGQQSMSIALLDDRHSGVVLTCIHHRDQARVYAKQVREGRGELELSPEEAEAVRVALDGAATPAAGSPRTPAGRAAETDASDVAGP